MTRFRLTVLIAACLTLVVPVASAQTAKPTAKPAPVTKAADSAAKLPAPILAAFKQAYPNATIKAATKEMENGKIEWEVESIDNGLARDLVYNPDGTVVEMEEQVAPASLPAAGVHGIAVAPDLGRAFVSNGRENTASIVDLKTLQITGSLKTGANPDCILYEPGHKEVYTFNGRDKSATVFDAATGEVKATIALPGKPEFAVVDVKAGRIYNNIEDTNEIAIIDTASHAMVAKWPIAPGEEASGLAIDLAHHRLFTVAGNNLLVALDSTTGKVLSTLPIGPGVDAAAYDPVTGFVFASSSDNTLTVARADAAGKLALVQTLATPARSRTMTLDPKTHRIYVSAAEFTALAPAAPGAQPQRPQMVPGSFKVVVYEAKLGSSS